MEDILYAQALLVEDGVIRAVGSEAEVRAAAGRDCEMVDLKGHTLMPAFIDAHSHFPAVPTHFCRCPWARPSALTRSKNVSRRLSAITIFQRGNGSPLRVSTITFFREKRPPAQRSAGPCRSRQSGDYGSPVRPYGCFEHACAGTAGNHAGYTCAGGRRDGGRGRKGDGLHGRDRFSELPEPRSNAGAGGPDGRISARAGRLCAAWRHHGAGRDDDTGDGTAVQAAVRGGPAEAGRGGISGYHTGGRHANGAVRTHRTVQRPF